MKIRALHNKHPAPVRDTFVSLFISNHQYRSHVLFIISIVLVFLSVSSLLSLTSLICFQMISTTKVIIPVILLPIRQTESIKLFLFILGFFKQKYQFEFLVSNWHYIYEMRWTCKNAKDCDIIFKIIYLCIVLVAVETNMYILLITERNPLEYLSVDDWWNNWLIQNYTKDAKNATHISTDLSEFS